MKLYTLTRRFTAAVLTAAMALSLCAGAGRSPRHRSGPRRTRGIGPRREQHRGHHCL